MEGFPSCPCNPKGNVLVRVIRLYNNLLSRVILVSARNAYESSETLHVFSLIYSVPDILP